CSSNQPLGGCKLASPCGCCPESVLLGFEPAGGVPVPAQEAIDSARSSLERIQSFNPATIERRLDLGRLNFEEALPACQRLGTPLRNKSPVPPGPLIRIAAN